MAKSRLSSVDTAWLRMEDPTNLMMITGVMVFGAPIAFDRLRATLEERLLRFDRFRQRVVMPRFSLGGHFWEDDPRFDLSDHIHRITLPAPGDRGALEDVVSHLMSTPLDFSRPLWEIHLVEHYGNGCALVARLHHCIADGIALVQVLLSLTDAEPDASLPHTTCTTTLDGDPGPLDTLFRPALSALKTTIQITDSIARESREMFNNPTHAIDLARLGTKSLAAAGRLALRWPDPKTLFKGELGEGKRAVWSEPIPLSEVKAVGRSQGGTVNDVLLSAVTGALRRYMQRRGAPVDGINIRAIVPVNLRSSDQKLELGNRFGLVFLSLPIGIADPIDRLFELKQRMDELKDTPEAMVAFGILGAIGAAPSEIQNIVVDVFGTKGTAVITNVPGPGKTIYLAGAALDTIMFWVPQSGRLGLGVSILSYAGKVWLGVATDQGLVPDPETIIGEFRAEFNELAAFEEQKRTAGTRDISRETKTSIQMMTATLDDAIEKINTMIAKTEQVTKEASEAARDRCQAMTKGGQPCKNRPLPDASFCRVHQKPETNSTP